MSLPTAESDSTIPWLDIIRFHRAIVQRAEEGYWTLDARDAESDRWTSLSDFDLNDLDGPWPVDPAAMCSPAWSRQLELGRIESMYLGGPGFVGRATLGGQSVECWQPLFYRDVQAIAVEGGFELRTVADEWLLNPLLYQLLDRLQLRPDLEPDVLNARVLQAARESVAGGALNPSVALVDSLCGLVPELRDQLQFAPRGAFATPPSPWVLFAPPSNVGTYNQQLVRDYDAMERVLDTSASCVASGLALLRPRPEPVVETHAEVLPFVPLNSTQERAVAVMLAGRPVTVVSGPPGCGKSQVVVSLLLNAWAQGQSVLFASNNNKAVDVVRDRLREFDAVHPVALRAGNSKVNNVATALRRIAQAAGSRGALAVDLEQLRTARANLREERQQVVLTLDTGIPQRIAEALDAALRAHGKFLTGRAAIEERDASMTQRLQDLTGCATQPDEVEYTLESTRAWLNQVTELRRQSLDEKGLRTRLDAEAKQALMTAETALTGVGIEVSDQHAWQAISDLHSTLNAWRDAARATLVAANVEMLGLTAWEPEYDRWSSQDHASENAAQLRALADAVTAAVSSAHQILLERKETSARESTEWRGLEECGWTERQRDKEIDLDALTAWLALWARFITAPPGFLGMSGALVRRPIRNNLAVLEAKFRDSIPLDAWRTIGPLDDVARNRLADVVERLVRHQDAFRASVLATRRVQELVDRLEQLRALGRAQGGPEVVDVLDSEQWSPVVTHHRELGEVATSAAAAWSLRSRREAIALAVQDLGNSWVNDIRSVPVLLPWIEGLGRGTDEIFAALTRSQTETAAQAAASGGEELAVLCAALSEALLEERRRQDAQSRSDIIPTETDRITESWGIQPGGAILIGSDRRNWPDISAYGARLALVDAWCAEWRPWAELERPKRLRQVELKRELALSRLREATEILPDSSEAQGVKARVEQVLESPGTPWPVGELRERFLPFLPERLRLRMSALDDALSRTAMDEAGARWGDRLGSEVSALNAISRLQQAAGPNGQGDLNRHPDHFRQALPIAPVWITTALSTRSIPLAPELFDLVVIDEASQCTLTNLLPILFRARRLVVIGDPQQLPAITVVQASEERLLANQFGVREFVPEFGHDRRDVYTVAREALPGAASDVIMLDEHYRSDPLIIGFSNRHVYQHQLRLRRTPRRRHDGIAAGVHGKHVAGTAQRPPVGSWRNEREARAVVERVRSLHAAGLAIDAMGVVTPFAGQKARLNALLKDAGLPVTVETAFGYQGDERDVIIFSPVVGPGMRPGTINWVEQPPNLLNVALTRARDALYVVGNLDFMAEQTGLLRELAKYVREVEALRAGHPAELALFSWMMMEGWTPTVHPEIGKDKVSFVLDGRPGVRVAVVVRALAFAESLKTEVERARDANLEAAGYRVVELIARDALETPAAVMQRIRNAM